MPLGAFHDSGRSALVTFQAFKSLVPNAEANIYLVDGPAGTSSAAAVAYLAQHHGGIGVFAHELPTDVANFGRVQKLPLAIGVVLALLAALILVHALVMATRARRRELAVLEDLGVRAGPGRGDGGVPGGRSSGSCVSAAIAVPLGVVVGRWSWRLFADQIGTFAVPIIPFVQITAVVAATIVVALAVAAGPARAASRVKPAIIFGLSNKPRHWSPAGMIIRSANNSELIARRSGRGAGRDSSRVVAAGGAGTSSPTTGSRPWRRPSCPWRSGRRRRRRRHLRRRFGGVSTARASQVKPALALRKGVDVFDNPPDAVVGMLTRWRPCFASCQ